MALRSPHFATPFRVLGNRVAAIEQDSEAEILGCVEAVLRTRFGSRIDEPEYGIPSDLFQALGPNSNVDDVLAAVAEWEPRAVVNAQITANVEELTKEVLLEMDRI